MALQQCGNQEDVLNDPIAVLEALRMTAGRVTVFCQQGRIAVPKKDTRLYSYLEQAVVEVQPPRGNGVFHPKVWLLRFISDEGPVLYRFLCLSRNLTFDRSWDTVLSLEGQLKKRKKAYARNHPLGDFFAALPSLAVRSVEQSVRNDVAMMADEVRRVDFEAPDGFYAEDIAFIPLGIKGYTKPPAFDEYRKLVVVSPFLSDEAVLSLVDSDRQNILVSRQESLDGLSDETIQALEGGAELFFLADTAERADDLEDQQEDAAPGVELGDLSGLHAKLYIADDGWHSRVLTGSANATSAALRGRNVELLVELWGRRGEVGVDCFLGGEDDKHAFRQMLMPYHREGKAPADPTARLMEQALDEARRAIAQAKLSAAITAGQGDTFDLALRPGHKPGKLPAGITGRCYLISRKPEDGLDIAPLANGKELNFQDLSMLALTSFVAFELTAEQDGRKTTIAFVLNVHVSGMPQERDRRILHAVISDPSRFIRYLLFILAGSDDPMGLRELITAEDGKGAEQRPNALGLPLLEELVRAFSRSPDKIERIGRLVEDLLQTPEGKDLLPEGFEQLWETFLAAAGKGAAS